MSEETIIKIETPEPEVIEPIATGHTTDIVEPVIDMAVKLGEVCAKMELVESALAASLADNAALKTEMEYIRTDLNIVRELATPAIEPEAIVEETPPDDLPIESLPEIEIVPEITPEIEEKVQKRKRFFV